MKKNQRLIALFVVLLGLYLNNSSLLVNTEANTPFILAHRGVHQVFPIRGIGSEINTARIILKPKHGFLENTLPSMQAAFEAGAEIVEIDIHPTKDGEFAVFHDWVLEHRTDGKGITREQTMAYLKTLDIGYGYTADSGKLFPFRGKFVRQMPTLAEVLERFLSKEFLIHIKSNDPTEGISLAKYISRLPHIQLQKLTFYGGDTPIATLKSTLPTVRVMSRQTAKEGLIVYTLLGWTGYIPKSISDTYIQLPLRYARFLWGWPHRFTSRMK